MTKSIKQPPNPEPKKPNLLQRLFNPLKSSPKRLAGGVVAIAAFGSLGYWGTQVLVKKKLPPFLENQIGKIIERPIDLGEVKGFSLNSIEFGETIIPPTATDTDKVTVEGVKVGFNIFPVLFGRTLPLDVALIQPDIYLEQQQDGEWIDLDFLQSDREQKDPLVYFDVDLDVEQADITAVPYQQNPLTGQVDGSGRFNQKQAFLEYDLDAIIEQAKASIQGETQLETGGTDTKLLVQNLALSDAATLLPIPVEIDTGTLNADLDINIPSFEEITAANIKGMVNLQNLEGEATSLNAPISAESKLNFSGRNADVKQTQASLGDITARVDGQVNLDTGYDLNVNVLPFQLATLPNNLTQQLPVDLAGEVQAQVQLRGAIKDPQLTGNVNNTQTVIIDQTPLKQIEADFRANLARVVLENVQIIPLAGGNVTAEGTIETNLRQALESDQPLDATKMPLAFSFQADLPTRELISPYYQLPQQVAIGELQAQGQIDGTVDNPKGLVKWNIADTNASNLEDIAGSGELLIANQNLVLQDTEIIYGDGQVDLTANANLDSKQWQASLDANSLNLTPFLSQFSNPNLNLDQPVAVDNATAKFNGKLDQLDLAKIQGTADLNLDVNGGDVAVNSQINAGNIQANATTNNIQLDSFITSLPVPASVQSGEISASGRLKQLLAFNDNPGLNSLQANADLNLQVDGEAVAVNSQIDSGRIQANANTSQIDLNRIAPNLPVPANIRSSQVTASGELRQLLTFAEQRNLSTVDARVDADLNVAEGTVRAIANLNNNQWQANLDANNVSSRLLLEKFAPSNLASVEVDNINAQANLTGDIQPILNNDTNIPVAVNQFTVNSGAQNVNARGNLTLANITSNLDVANTNLNIAANLDFDRLPIDQIVAATSQDNELIAQSVNVGGQAEFNGQFNGQQLLSAPTENVSLTGDLRLLDFAFNEIDFDPVMTGTLDVQPYAKRYPLGQQEIALNLQGQQDVIAARAVPCNTSDCQLPYLPTNLEIRQGEDTNQPVIATGDRQGDIFSLDVDNFPLALLNLAPGTAAGIEGALAGRTTGEVDLDLYTLAAEGNINIDNPGLGYIQADSLNADFNYNPASNIAAINSASLNLGDSEYNLNAALNLESGQIDGRLGIPQAYIQDVLTTLRWFTVEDVTNLFNIPDYAEASAIRPAPEKETVDESIARKLNQLRKVNSQIQANAAAQEVGSIPTELDIQGKYQGEVILGGTIQTPQADFRVEGNDWQWQPKSAYPNIVNPLGLVIEEAQYISLPKLVIAGDLQGTTVDLNEASIQLQEAVLSLQGQLSPEQLNTEFSVANLTVDNISNFVNIPVDLAGEINSVGTIEGTPNNPQIAGKVAFSDGAFNGNLLPSKLAGNFNYDGSEVVFNTTAPDSIQVKATVPYPIIPGKSDRLTASANLEQEAFVFLAAFSQNYLNWTGGEGNAQLEASASLDLNRENIIYDLDAQGVVNLKDANVLVETPFFSEPFIGTGKITLNNQIVNVETLNGTFADKDLSVTGKLPILTAVNNLDNPLTIDLPPGDIEIDELYQGGVEGQVTVTGASLKPVIGGEVTLEDGDVSIPESETPTQEDTVQFANTKVSDTVAGTKATNKAQAQPQNAAAKSSFVTALNNLKVNLKDFNLQQDPLYTFQLKGGLTLNGTIDEPSNIIPQGRLLLTQADVDLFSNSFSAARNRENTIVFTPNAGIFNPELDIILRTTVEDVDGQEFSNLRLAEANSNEIADPLSSTNSSQTVRISLVIDGETTEILPNLAQTRNLNCNIRPNNEPLVEKNQYYAEAELNRFTQCFNQIADAGGDNRNLINSPAVELTSIPSLNQGEIVNLLSGQFIAFARDVSNRSQSELFDLGVNKFILTPLQNEVFYFVEDTTVRLGRNIGLDYLTVFPNLEAIYELNQDSSVRSTYNYVLNEATIEYQRNF
ncbi:MAG TPA: translocation/assembly module TamB domain-containing protein [Coleofasciculaceae cyanobacterium]|jgi:autotransporter translocation and assembly factor TamB